MLRIMTLFSMPRRPPNKRFNQPNIAILSVFEIMFETNLNNRFVPTNNMKKLMILTTDTGNDGKKERIYPVNRLIYVIEMI
jgi:hypothetical protein